MNTTSEQTVTESEAHRLDTLRWQADVHERNGRKQEAFEIRTWVADFLSPQSEDKIEKQIVGWRTLPRP
jgi:hypothetical protein